MAPVNPVIPAPTEVEAGISRGLQYLLHHQFPNGEFAAYIAADVPMQGWTIPDSCVFPTALIGNCLLALQDRPAADHVLTRATEFLRYQMFHGGVWNHFTRLHHFYRLCPFDSDDTACVSALLRARGIECPRPSNVPLLLANRTREGLFYTWFLLRASWIRHRTFWRITLPELLYPLRSLLFWYKVEASRHDVDGVVNANVLYYLGDIAETQPVIAYLLRIIAEHREATCDLWYLDSFFVYYAFTRCYHTGISKLEPLREPIVQRILARAQPDGRLGDTLLDTAWAIISLLNLRSYPPELDAAVGYLLRAQCPGGEWPRWLLYYGGPKRLQGWGSEEMSTAFCLEALGRYQQLRPNAAPAG
jgi:hypothetical protein